MGELYGDPSMVWRPWVSGELGSRALPSGQHVAEEAPDELVSVVLDLPRGPGTKPFFADTNRLLDGSPEAWRQDWQPHRGGHCTQGFLTAADRKSIAGAKKSPLEDAQAQGDGRSYA